MEMAKEPLQHELTEARRAVAATSPEEEGLLTRTVEDGTLRVLVAFEAFFSDWLPRCLHLDTAELRRKADQRVRARVQGVAGDVASDVNEAAAIRMAVERFPPRVQATTTMPKRIRLSEARKIVGTDEATISLREVDHMGALVNGVLVQKYRNRLHTLSDSQKATLQAVIKIRNVIAHRSDRAVTELNKALSDPGLPQALRSQRNVTAAGLGKYLTVTTAGHPRYEHYFRALDAITTQLAPS